MPTKLKDLLDGFFIKIMGLDLMVKKRSLAFQK